MGPMSGLKMVFPSFDPRKDFSWFFPEKIKFDLDNFSSFLVVGVSGILPGWRQTMEKFHQQAL